MLDDFVKVADLSEIARDAGTAVTVADNAIALFRLDSELFALDDACLRCGGSLASGSLHGRFAACSRCDWQYDVASGTVKGVPQLHTSRFAVKIVETQVLVSRFPAP